MDPRALTPVSLVNLAIPFTSDMLRYLVHSNAVEQKQIYHEFISCSLFGHITIVVAFFRLNPKISYAIAKKKNRKRIADGWDACDPWSQNSKKNNMVSMA